MRTPLRRCARTLANISAHILPVIPWLHKAARAACAQLSTPAGQWSCETMAAASTQLHTPLSCTHALRDRLTPKIGLCGSVLGVSVRCQHGVTGTMPAQRDRHVARTSQVLCCSSHARHCSAAEASGSNRRRGLVLLFFFALIFNVEVSQRVAAASSTQTLHTERLHLLGPCVSACT